MVQTIQGFGEIAEKYELVILDLWGVVHNGQDLFPGVKDCLTRMRKAGVKIVFLSNAPRPCDAVAAGLERVGLESPADYGLIMSSGDVTREALLTRPDAWHQKLGQKVYHLGPERDKGILANTDYVEVPSIERCDFVLNTGPFDDLAETRDDYAAAFQDMKDYRLPMVCANPDIQVHKAGQKVDCAGALALAYEAIGGDVVSHGKPYRTTYEYLLKRAGAIDVDKIVAIGDNLLTDIAGANTMGYDSVLIPGGIHSDAMGISHGSLPSDETLTEVIKAEGGYTPTYVMPILQW